MSEEEPPNEYAAMLMFIDSSAQPYTAVTGRYWNILGMLYNGDWSGHYAALVEAVAQRSVGRDDPAAAESASD